MGDTCYNCGGNNGSPPETTPGTTPESRRERNDCAAASIFKVNEDGVNTGGDGGDENAHGGEEYLSFE